MSRLDLFNNEYGPLMHKLLLQQMERLGLDKDNRPEGWEELLDRVSHAYELLEERVHNLEEKYEDDTNDTLRSAFDGAGSGMVVLSGRGEVVEANAAFAVAYGSSVQEVKGKLFKDFFQDPHRDAFLRSWNTVNKMAKYARREKIALGGSRHTWIDLTIARVHELSERRPEHMKFIVQLQDVTQWHHAEEGLTRFRHFIDHGHTIVLVANLRQDGRFIDFNTAALEVYGYESFEILSMNLRDLETQHPLGTNEEWQMYLDKVRHSSTHHSYEGMHQKRDGSLLPVEVIATTHTYDDGEYLLLMVEDQTERRAMEEALEAERSKVVVSAKMASVGEMAGSIAHEVNNPLALIKALVQVLEEEADDGDVTAERVKEIAGKVANTCTRLGKIVKGMKSVARDSKNDPFTLLPLSEVIEDTTSLCQARMHNHKIKLEVDECPEHLMIECRPSQIIQVLLNLLNNASDAIENETEKWIHLKIIDSGEFIQIEVSDSGPGIPKEHEESLLNPYFTTKEVGKGTGLGLSISRNLVDTHNGKFYYDPERQYTTFVVVLPKQQMSQQKSA